MTPDEEAAFVAQQEADAAMAETLAVAAEAQPIDPAMRTGLKKALGLTDKQTDALLARAAELAA